MKAFIIYSMKKTLLIIPFLIFLFKPTLVTNVSDNFYFLKKHSFENNNITKESNHWVDSVFESLSLDERIAQLLMIRVQSNRNDAYYNAISATIKQYNVGGLCFFRGTPHKQARLTNRWQAEAQTPMLIAIDGEWGLAMRLDSTVSYPRQMTLGAIQNDRLIYEMGAEIARQLNRMGIHMNFAPVVDINSNPANPVINTRSFGECRYNVTRKSFNYMKGMQDNGIIAVAKHFPGHGDTDTDSHYTLPVLNHDRARLDSLELYPFKKLFSKGLQSVMIAHLNIPAFIAESHVASTLSDSIVTHLLKKELGFDGLVVTDALDMQGVSDHFKPGEIEVEALKAGNDILLLPQDVGKAVDKIKKALIEGYITEDIINERCRKVLTYKYKAGLHNYIAVDLNNLHGDLNTPYAEQLRQELIENAVTLVKNNNDIIPFKNTRQKKIASLAIGDGQTKTFQQKLSAHYELSVYRTSKNLSRADINTWKQRLSGYDKIFISIHNTNSLPQRNFGITQESIDLINELKKEKKIILSIFANPYALGFFNNFENIEALFISFHDERHAQETTARIIMGELNSKGRLPVTGAKDFPVYAGISTGKYANLTYVSPSHFGITEKTINKIDSMALNGILQEAYPGCQILFAKNGKVFYHKSFGHHTYDSTRTVRNSDLYDIASVTKIAATTLAIMRLYDEGKLKLNDRLGDHLHYLRGTNKAAIQIKDILGHQAGLNAWIAFYAETLKDGKPDPAIYATTASPEFPVQVAHNMYIHKNYYDTIIQQIVDFRLGRKTYRYSDVGFYFLREIIEKLSGQRFDNYLYNTFYKPMGLNRTLFNPLRFFGKEEITPSEVDNYFRHQIIHGFVNDQGAAMTGGIGGHAGLFSNAWEMAVIMQMLLNNGKLGDTQYLKPGTVEKFTRRHFVANNRNRRGLGFDKPLINNNGNGPTCKSASSRSYGHSGFTGAYIWADPEYNLIYVFLSNRTYPDPQNRKISRMNIRTEIHQVVYDALENKTK